jgi:hypothetical protein
VERGEGQVELGALEGGEGHPELGVVRSLHPELLFRPLQLGLGRRDSFEGLVERFGGMAAAAGREWALAERHFEAALALADDLPLVPEQTLVRYWYGRALLDRAGAGDRERARELLAEALTRAESSGLRGLTRRIEESLAEFR